MTSELKSQRDELVGANSTLDERNRFMEAVLSGVTAGVVGVDADGTVNLVNRSAKTLLGVKEEKLTGKKLSEAVPEFGPHLKRAKKQGKRLATDQVTLRRGGSERNFAVRVTSEGAGKGYVVTFDDITELVSAQRSTAWADIARRIAHEIKNPLTPIQLSAERIRRKYGNSITKDREIFEQCTDTIIRQVSDIGRMVDEFSAFARMPKPVMEMHDVREIVREAVFLFQVSRPDIKFELDLPDKPVMTMSDQRLSTQAVTNLVKNASEGDRHRRGGRPVARGHRPYHREGGTKGDHVHITVIDNGCGLPGGEPRAPGRAVHDHARQRHRTWTGHRAADHRAAWRQTTTHRCAQAQRQDRRGVSANGPADFGTRGTGGGRRAHSSLSRPCERIRAGRGGRGSNRWRLTS